MSLIPKSWSDHKLGISITLSVLIVAAVVAVYFFTPLFESVQPQSGSLMQREIAKMEKAVAENPANPDGRVGLALFYLEDGNTQEAIIQLEAALEINESHQGAMAALGGVYMTLEQYEQAIELYQKIVELNEDNPMRGLNQRLIGVYYFEGVAYSNLGRYGDAIRSLEEALTLDATDSDAWYILGVAYQNINAPEKAIEAFSQAVRFVPNFTEAYQGLAQSYEKAGQTDNVTYADAMVSYSLGSAQEAIVQLEEIVARNPDFAEAYLGLGLSYEKEGEIDKAIEAYQEVVRLSPHTWLANVRLQDLMAGQP